MKLARIILAVAAITLLGMGQAQAGTVLSFTQTSNSNTVTGQAIANFSIITGNNIAISTPQFGPAELSFALVSVAQSTQLLGAGYFSEQFTGSFEITSQPNAQGTNFLSDYAGSTLTLIGNLNNPTSFTLSASGTTFTSDVLTVTPPTSYSWTLTNLAGAVLASTLNNNGTLNSFTASINGSFSGTSSSVPEPSSMVLFGLGGIGLALRNYRRRLNVA